MKSQIERPNGSKLGFEDVGRHDGKPLFYFHGVPSSGSDWRMWGDESLLESTGVRLIAVDRPGTGESTFQPGRRISDWPSEVIAIADHLGFEQFSVLGYSGGGPYAAVCAAMIPERLHSAGLVSSLVSFDHKELLEGINPRNVQFLNLSIEKPWLFRFFYWQVGLLAKLAPQKYIGNALQTFDTADHDAFSKSNVQKAFLSATGSPQGQQWDTRLLLSPWDFRIEDIIMQVQLWQGDQDRNVSPAMGRYLEKCIPNNCMTFMPGEGHISIMVNHALTILKSLMQ